MATAASTAGSGIAGGDKKDEAAAAVPPPVQAESTWPKALRIDVELAENHARRRTEAAAGWLGRIDEENRARTVTTTRPSNHPRQQPQSTKRNPVQCGGGDGGGDNEEKTWKKAGVAAGLRIDVGLAESHARPEGPAALATGGIGRLRDLLENRSRVGIMTRSNRRRTKPREVATPKNVVTDGEDTNTAPGDGGVPSQTTLGGAGEGGAANSSSSDQANDATCSIRSAGKRILSNAGIRFWSGQEGAAMAGGGEAAVASGVCASSETREGGQGRTKRLRRGGVGDAEREKVRFGSFD